MFKQATDALQKGAQLGRPHTIPLQQVLNPHLAGPRANSCSRIVCWHTWPMQKLKALAKLHDTEPKAGLTEKHTGPKGGQQAISHAMSDAQQLLASQELMLCLHIKDSTSNPDCAAELKLPTVMQWEHRKQRLLYRGRPGGHQHRANVGQVPGHFSSRRSPGQADLGRRCHKGLAGAVSAVPEQPHSLRQAPLAAHLLAGCHAAKGASMALLCVTVVAAAAQK